MVIVKVLIDVREYERLKQIEQQFNDKKNESKQEQSGAGQSHDQENYLRKIIRDELDKTYNQQHESTLVTPQADMLPPVTSPPNSSAVRLDKDGPDSPMDGPMDTKQAIEPFEDVAEMPTSKNKASAWYYLGPI